MKIKATLPELIQWQKDRALTGYSELVDIEKFKNQFEGIPNEACHLFDCQTMEVHLVDNNFSEVFGIPDFQPKDISELIGTIHPDHLQYSLDFMGVSLANERVFECGKDSVSQLYKIANGKMILKTSTPLQMDAKKHVTLVAEQYKDVSDLVGSNYKWSFAGPNAEKLEALVNNIFEKDCPITNQELTVLGYVGNGYSSKEAAEVMFLSKHTIDTHRRNILKKLSVNNTSEALKKMIDMGFLS